jgi:ankyrin repeat protein
MRVKLQRWSVGWCLAIAASSASLAGTSDLPLIQAVRNHDIELVRRLIEKHADVNAARGDGATALHWAARLDDVTTTDLLIRAGANVNAADDDGATPLFAACMNHSAPIVERLLKGGADAKAKLLNGETALMTCARTGDASAVRALLVHGADVNAKESAHSQTALMWAAAGSHPEVVGQLLEFGADVRARSSTYSQTVVGEDTQRAGRESLNYTVLRGGYTPLLFAARSGDVESAKLLLRNGANSNDSSPDGMTVLVLAAHSGHGGVGELLLENGADPNAAGIGYAALHAAVLRSDLNLVKALLAHGANPNLRIAKGTPVRRDTTDFNLLAPLIGSTSYLLAAKFLEFQIMQVLKAGGANTTMAMPDGTTALMLAAGNGSRPNQSRRGISVVDFGKVEPETQVVEAVKMAVNLGAEVNAANNGGDTALHNAAGLGYNSVVQFLADHGARIDAKNKRGLTPLAVALRGTSSRRNAPANADGDLNGEPAKTQSHPSTAALLRKLGATE